MPRPRLGVRPHDAGPPADQYDASPPTRATPARRSGTVAERLPAGLSVDTFEGDAYLGVVPFVMSAIGPRGLPVGLAFGELNLRTCVTVDGEPGVYFFDLNADDRVGVALARSPFRLPYYRADVSVETSGDGRTRAVEFRSRRRSSRAPPARFDATYGADGSFSTPDHGSLAAFLTERYRFYTTDDGGRVYYGDIDHEPGGWRQRGPSSARTPSSQPAGSNAPAATRCCTSPHPST